MPDEATVRGFHPSFEEKVIHLVIGDESFLRDNKPILQPGLFGVDNHRFIIQTALDYSNKYGKHPCQETLRELVRSSNYKDRGGVLNIIDSVNGFDDADYVRDQLAERARWQAIDNAILQSSTPEELSDRIREAVVIGKSSRQSCINLEDDNFDDPVGFIVPTPWGWLNDQLLGGPVKQDLAVVLSVINGGKTAALVNIAYRAIIEGLAVVYLTFEDGDKKIARRFKQLVGNMTMEEVILHPQRATHKMHKFLELTGGHCTIKTLASRRDGVAEAAAFLKGLPHKPDVVITDYADRFRPKAKYTEPRHSLREIFEDCKQLAKDFDVLHWTARQVNKTRMGQSVVGTEHAGEAWGTMESPDLVIGLGRTMEDERLGRLMLFTAKVRDHESHKLHPLMVDFDKQRIWDPED